jgi:hypothetical protein
LFLFSFTRFVSLSHQLQSFNSFLLYLFPHNYFSFTEFHEVLTLFVFYDLNKWNIFVIVLLFFNFNFNFNLQEEKTQKPLVWDDIQRNSEGGKGK